MRLLTFSLLFACTILSAQDRPLTYFSQVSFGRPIYSEIGKGIIEASDINGDSIADVAFGAHTTFQVGYGRIENGKLYFDMQAIDFIENDFFRGGQLIDVDSDGDVDFTIKRNINFFPPIVYKNYVFDNKGGTIQVTPDAPPQIFPQDLRLYFGAFNNDSITDAYYRLDGEQVILDGAKGQIYKPFSTDSSSLGSNQVTVIDLNGDGMLDFLLQLDNPPGLDTFEHEIYINQGDFGFSTFRTRGVLGAQDHGDFDGDGILDIIGDADTGSRLHFRIKSNLMSADSADFFDLNITGQSYDPSLLPYDLNDDGYDDVVVFTEDTVYFCKNNQDKTFEIFNFPQENPVYLHFTSHPSWPLGTVISEYGYAVPLLYQLDFDGTQFSVKRSSATISPPVLLEPPYYHRLTTLDADMDGQLELGIRNEFEIVAAEFENDAFQEYTAHDFGIADLPFFSAMASTDFNNDGMLDMVFALINGPDVVQICYGQPDSTFSSPITLTTNFALCFKIDVGDFDGNGFIDIAASGGLSDDERFSIFLNQNGTQFIEKQVLDSRHEAWNIIDPNADGIADLAISKNSTKIYMNDGQGNLDSTQIFAGRVVKNNETNTPFIFTSLGNLLKIDSAGTGSTIIGNADVYVSNRTGYMLDYNLDGLPDLLYSEPDISNNRYDTTYLVLADTVNPWEVRAFPNRYVQGVVDIDGDGTEDVLWQIGSQLWVELVNTPVWSAIVEQKVEPLRIFPNPATAVLHFGNADWEAAVDTYFIQIYSAAGQLVFSKTQHGNSIDVGGLERGAYFLILRTGLGERYGGSFIKL